MSALYDYFNVLIFTLLFFFNEMATTEIYTYFHTLSLHDALPISLRERAHAGLGHRRAARRHREQGKPRMRGRRMVDRPAQHVGLEHHPRAAARRGVVDGAVPVGRDVADLHRRARPQAAFERTPRHARPQRTGPPVGLTGQGEDRERVA